MGTLQFTIPRLAADAIDFRDVRNAGRFAGIEHTWIEVSDYRVVEFGKTRITCSAEMGVHLLEALAKLSTHAHDHGMIELRDAAIRGSETVLEAIREDAKGPRIKLLEPNGPPKPKIGS